MLDWQSELFTYLEGLMLSLCIILIDVDAFTGPYDNRQGPNIFLPLCMHSPEIYLWYVALSTKAMQHHSSINSRASLETVGQLSLTVRRSFALAVIDCFRHQHHTQVHHTHVYIYAYSMDMSSTVLQCRAWPIVEEAKRKLNKF